MTIGFVGFGEAGYHFAKGLGAAGAGPMLAFDIHAATPGRGERIRSRAQETATVLVDCPAGLAECRVLISVVTANSALEAASQNRPFLQSQQIYADFNSVSPDMKKAICQEISSSPAHFVEGAIMAPVPPNGHRVPILLNGPFAGELAASLAPFGMKLECLSAEIGAAAAIKMCRSIVVKGLEALLLECTLGASRYGARDMVFASLSESFPGIQWQQLAEYMAGRVFEHGERRAREMEEVAHTLRAIGVDPIMSEAAAQVQDWRARFPTGTAAPSSVKEMIAALGGATE
jgi:3-hydroxyisobutyrate dehydrogenase-like beta-hydroxyacid dehydrogenase